MSGPAPEARALGRVLLTQKVKRGRLHSRLLQACNGDTKTEAYLSVNPRRPI
ncbi:hypothetical protein V1278_005542 [Bradyrhizobium sp. AZCC 1577]